MFVTSFYSYKGGVGRTVALLNVTWELAHRGWRVAILDLDLEAPGLQDACLERVDPPENGVSWRPASPQRGFCTLVREYQSGTSAATIRDNVERYLVQKLGPEKRVALLAAHGEDDDAYEAFVDRFSWVDFYLSEDHPGKAATAALVLGLSKLGYDYLLIDARTGLTDVRGATLIDMPDLVVLVTNLSTQSVTGIARQLEDIEEINRRIENGEPSLGRRPGRETTPIKTLVVGSPLPAGELLRRQSRIAHIESAFLNRPLDVQIDYVPFLSLEEGHQIVAQVTDLHGAMHRRVVSPYQDLTDSIVRLNSLAPENLITQGDELLKLGRWREALAHYDEIVDEKQSELPTRILRQARSGKTWAQLRAVTQIDHALKALDKHEGPPAEEAERRLGAAWALVVAERFTEAADQAERARSKAETAAKHPARDRNVGDPDERFLSALSGFAAGQAFGLDCQWERAAQRLKETHRACQVSETQPLLHALALAEWGRVTALIGTADDGEFAMTAAKRLPVRSTYVLARIALAEGELFAETGRGVTALGRLETAGKAFDGDTDYVGVLEARVAAAEIDPKANAESLSKWEERAVSLLMRSMASRITVMRAERALLANDVTEARKCLQEASERLGNAGAPNARSRGEAQQRARWLQAECRVAIVCNDINAAIKKVREAQQWLEAATTDLSTDLSTADRIPLFHEQRLLTALLALQSGDPVELGSWAEFLEQRGLVTRALQARFVQAMDPRTAAVDDLVKTMSRGEQLGSWQWNLPIAFVAHVKVLRDKWTVVLKAANCPWPTIECGS